MRNGKLRSKEPNCALLWQQCGLSDSRQRSNFGLKMNLLKFASTAAGSVKFIKVAV
jgi:hypothetical protein